MSKKYMRVQKNFDKNGMILGSKALKLSSLLSH